MIFKVVFFLTIYIALALFFSTGIKTRKLRLLFWGIAVVHLLTTFFYYYYSLYKGADSIVYYKSVLHAQSWWDLYRPGSGFIMFVLYPFVHYLGFSHFLCYLPFSILSLLGYRLFISTLCYKFGWTIKTQYYILLLPQLHFWTCAIGKDSLIFFGICLFTYAICLQSKNWKLIIFSLIIIASVRFHIFTFIFVGLSVSTIYFSSKKMYFKVLSTILFATTIVIIAPIFAQNIGLDENLDVEEYTEKTLSHNQGGGSSVDMSSASYPIKIISYIGRPLFFDAKTVFQLEASFENIVWIYIFFYVLMGIIRNKAEVRKRANIHIIMLFALLLPLSYILNNLGIAMRQKTMFFPFLFVIFIYLKHNQTKTNI